MLFTTGGTEAMEHAVRMARLYTGRPKVLAAYRSYHGSTTTSIHLTGDPRRWASDTGGAGRGPLLRILPVPVGVRVEDARGGVRAGGSPPGAGHPPGGCVDDRGPGPGVGGGELGRHRAAPAGYLQGVRELCTRHGIVYIADEVLVGFGRTGAWFGVDHDGVAPDLMVFAKGVNSGYVPLGGVMVGDAIHEFFTRRPYPAGMTYSGHRCLEVSKREHALHQAAVPCEAAVPV